MEGNRGKSEARAQRVADAATLVVRVVGDIDSSSPAQRWVLLSDFLCAAWPTERAQSQ
jgi:hypothetical protein